MALAWHVREGSGHHSVGGRSYAENYGTSTRLRAASVAGAAAVAGLAVTDSARADDDEGGNSVVGAWVVTHRDDPPGPPNIGKSVVTAALGGAFENVAIPL